jgi:hypothetical protein
MEVTKMRGRKPSGVEYVQNLDGSAEAKRRLQVVLETMTGARRVLEACDLLDISESRFHQLRLELLQAALERLERRPAGRPRATPASPEVDLLHEQVAELAKELDASHVREEVAMILPGRRQTTDDDSITDDSQKKTPRRPKRRARPGWWKK